MQSLMYHLALDHMFQVTTPLARNTYRRIGLLGFRNLCLDQYDALTRHTVFVM